MKDKARLQLLMAELFEHGLALDLINLEDGQIKDLSLVSDSDEKELYEISEYALQSIDIEELYENAEALHILDKYPEFYEFLKQLQKNLDLGDDDITHEHTTESNSTEEAEEEIEEVTENLEEELSLKDSVIRNIVGGEHTGDQRDSEKYVEKDEIRRKLTAEYNKMIEEATAKSKASRQIKNAVVGAVSDEAIEAHIPDYGNKEVADMYHRTGQGIGFVETKKEDKEDSSEEIKKRKQEKPSDKEPQINKPQQGHDNAVDYAKHDTVKENKKGRIAGRVYGDENIVRGENDIDRHLEDVGRTNDAIKVDLEDKSGLASPEYKHNVNDEPERRHSEEQQKYSSASETKSSGIDNQNEERLKAEKERAQKERFEKEKAQKEENERLRLENEKSQRAKDERKSQERERALRDADKQEKQESIGINAENASGQNQQIENDVTTSAPTGRQDNVGYYDGRKEADLNNLSKPDMDNKMPKYEEGKIVQDRFQMVGQQEVEPDKPKLEDITFPKESDEKKSDISTGTAAVIGAEKATDIISDKSNIETISASKSGSHNQIQGASHSSNDEVVDDKDNKQESFTIGNKKDKDNVSDVVSNVQHSTGRTGGTNSTGRSKDNNVYGSNYHKNESLNEETKSVDDKIDIDIKKVSPAVPYNGSSLHPELSEEQRPDNLQQSSKSIHEDKIGNEYQPYGEIHEDNSQSHKDNDLSQPAIGDRTPKYEEGKIVQDRFQMVGQQGIEPDKPKSEDVPLKKMPDKNKSDALGVVTGAVIGATKASDVVAAEKDKGATLHSKSGVNNHLQGSHHDDVVIGKQKEAQIGNQGKQLNRLNHDKVVGSDTKESSSVNGSGNNSGVNLGNVTGGITNNGSKSEINTPDGNKSDKTEIKEENRPNHTEQPNDSFKSYTENKEHKYEDGKIAQDSFQRVGQAPINESLKTETVLPNLQKSQSPISVAQNPVISGKENNGFIGNGVNKANKSIVTGTAAASIAAGIAAGGIVASGIRPQSPAIKMNTISVQGHSFTVPSTMESEAAVIAKHMLESGKTESEIISHFNSKFNVDAVNAWNAAVSRADNFTTHNLTTGFAAGKEVADSYQSLASIQNMTAADLGLPSFSSFGSYSSISVPGTPDKFVDFGTQARKNGNVISMQVGNTVKQFTMRPDNTIVVNNSVMHVYKGKGDSVFVGWKGLPVVGNTVYSAFGENLDLTKSQDLNNVIVDKFGKIKFSVTDGKNIGGTKLLEDKSISYLPAVMEKDDLVFSQNGNIFSASGYSFKYGAKNIQSVLRQSEIQKTLMKQGNMMILVYSKKQLNRIRDALNLSDADFEILARNYGKIISVNGGMINNFANNLLLEKKYLSSERLLELKNMRTALLNAGIESKFVKDIDTLKKMLNEGAFKGETQKLVSEYIKAFENSRIDILKGITTSENLKNLEIGMIAAMYPVLLKEKGLPTNMRKLFRLFHSGTLNESDMNLVKNAISVMISMKALKLVKRMALSVYSNIKKTMHFLTKHMGDDYALKGMMLLASAATMPYKAYKMARRSFKMGKNMYKVGKTTFKAAGAIGKAGMAAGRAMKTGRMILRRGGLKGGTKSLLLRLRGKKLTPKGILKKMTHTIKKGVMKIAMVIIRILIMLVSMLLSILGPLIFTLLFVLILIFSILSFIKNSGDDVYYDAGDEDTSEVVQEMIDLSTLCHASFRGALSSQFGAGVGAYGSGSGSVLNAPQLKKGESSPVKGLYDVTAGTWSNWEYGYPYPDMAWDAGRVQDMLTSGQLKVRNNGGMLFIEEKMYGAAFTEYWGRTGDVVKIEFEGSIAIGDQPATNTLYVLVLDTKNYEHTGYPEQPEGLYGHPLGGHRDLAEFFWWGGAQKPNLNGSSLGMPLKVTNMGSLLNGTCDMSLIGSSSMSGAASVNADVLYRQEIDHKVYRNLIDIEKNIYYTDPEEQDVPDGITPTPTIEEYAKDKPGEIYGFYNNNQEMISMILAMFDFDINASTSVKRTVLMTEDTSGADDNKVTAATKQRVTNKLNDDTWRLVTYLDENGLDMTRYKKGGYDDLKYSAFVGLFNASHIVTGTPVLEYHEGPDGTINPKKKWCDENNNTDTGGSHHERIVGQDNKDGMSYLVPVMVTKSMTIIDPDTKKPTVITWEEQDRDADGELVFETRYKPCPGHRSNSAAVITLHFDSILNLKDWWKKNIYDVDDFDKENMNYSSDNKKDPNYNLKEQVLKPTFQYIKKPDFYKSTPGTCQEGSSVTGGINGSAGFSPGTMTETQTEVARAVYSELTTKFGLTSEQAVGVLVNIKRECDFNYTLIENTSSSKKGYGLCQWTGDRRTQLVNWCNSHPEDGAYNTLKGQLSYLYAEFTVYTDVWTGNGPNGLKQCKTAREAGEYFIRYFERPAAEHLATRLAEMDSDIATVKKYLNLN